MIFAVIDYIKYRFHYGKYSLESIKKQGGRLATKENVPSPQSFLPGTNFVYHSFDSFISWLIMYYTSSVWSHCGIIVGDGYVADATTGGFIKHPLADYLDGKGCIAFTRYKEMDEESGKRVAAHAESLVGAAFNYIGVICLFFTVIFGINPSYRIRFSLDILISLLILAIIFYSLKMNFIALVYIGLCYILITVINIIKSGNKITF